MIISSEKSTPLNSPSELDLPPAYADLVHAADALPDPPSLKPPFSHLPPTSPDASEPVSPQPESSSSKSPLFPLSYIPNWSFSWPTSQLTAEQAHVQNNIRNLLLSLLKPNSASEDAALGIFESCRTACSTYGVPFHETLQERFIQNHSVLYWALVKRPNRDEDALLDALISAAKPFSPSALDDLRAACLVSSDNKAFRRYIYPHTVAAADKLLLDENSAPDRVDVDDSDTSDDEFVVHMVLAEFQRRMGVRGELTVEFIAKGRLFKLAFSASPAPSAKGKQSENAWSISLALHDGSPATWIDSRLLIPDATSSEKPKPTVSLRLKSGSDPLRAPPLYLDEPLTRRERRARGREREQLENKIVIGIGSSLMGAGLMYSGSSYIGLDGKLTAQFEARLRKPDTECIIC